MDNPAPTDQSNYNGGSPSGAALGSAPPADWPVEARISHRIMIYAARRRTYGMNQMTIEDIVREELAKEPNVRVSHSGPSAGTVKHDEET